MSLAFVDEVVELQPTLKSYLIEAVELEKSGKRIAPGADRALDNPDELEAKFESDPNFKVAFEALTPGRQRGYVLHFSAAKQSRTRASQIAACQSKILAGKGFHDCTCGLSQRMPRCDGSHTNPN